MAINVYLSIITLNINENASIKRQRVAEQIRKQEAYTRKSPVIVNMTRMVCATSTSPGSQGMCMCEE